MAEKEKKPADNTTGELTSEENLLSFLLTVGVPFIIALISFGAIALAFYQWKIY